MHGHGLALGKCRSADLPRLSGKTFHRAGLWRTTFLSISNPHLSRKGQWVLVPTRTRKSESDLGDRIFLQFLFPYADRQHDRHGSFSHRRAIWPRVATRAKQRHRICWFEYRVENFTTKVGPSLFGT